MRGCYPDKLTLKKKDVTILQQLLRDGRTSLRIARRAQILVTRASNQRVGQVVAKVDQHASTVWRVCERYRQRGLIAITERLCRLYWRKIPELKYVYALTEKARAGEQIQCSDDYESGG